MQVQYNTKEDEILFQKQSSQLKFQQQNSYNSTIDSPPLEMKSSYPSGDINSSSQIITNNINSINMTDASTHESNDLRMTQNQENSSSDNNLNNDEFKLKQKKIKKAEYARNRRKKEQEDLENLEKFNFEMESLLQRSHLNVNCPQYPLVLEIKSLQKEFREKFWQDAAEKVDTNKKQKRKYERHAEKEKETGEYQQKLKQQNKLSAQQSRKNKKLKQDMLLLIKKKVNELKQDKIEDLKANVLVCKNEENDKEQFVKIAEKYKHQNLKYKNQDQQPFLQQNQIQNQNQMYQNQQNQQLQFQNEQFQFENQQQQQQENQQNQQYQQQENYDYQQLENQQQSNDQVDWYQQSSQSFSQKYDLQQEQQILNNDQNIVQDNYYNDQDFQIKQEENYNEFDLGDLNNTTNNNIEQNQVEQEIYDNKFDSMNDQFQFDDSIQKNDFTLTDDKQQNNNENIYNQDNQYQNNVDQSLGQQQQIINNNQNQNNTNIFVKGISMFTFCVVCIVALVTNNGIISNEQEYSINLLQNMFNNRNDVKSNSQYKVELIDLVETSNNNPMFEQKQIELDLNLYEINKLKCNDANLKPIYQENDHELHKKCFELNTRHASLLREFGCMDDLYKQYGDYSLKYKREGGYSDGGMYADLHVAMWGLLNSNLDQARQVLVDGIQISKNQVSTYQMLIFLNFIEFKMECTNTDYECGDRKINQMFDSIEKLRLIEPTNYFVPFGKEIIAKLMYMQDRDIEKGFQLLNESIEEFKVIQMDQTLTYLEMLKLKTYYLFKQQNYLEAIQYIEDIIGKLRNTNYPTSDQLKQCLRLHKKYWYWHLQSQNQNNINEDILKKLENYKDYSYLCQNDFTIIDGDDQIYYQIKKDDL